MRIRSPQQHAFSMVPKADIPRSSFDRSHGHKTTFDAGFLIPIFLDEALPGDTFNCSMTGFARMATPIFPIMDNAYMETFFFAVPYRLIWDNWERFNGAQDDPGDSTDFLIPQITSYEGGYAEGSIYDYLGLPTIGQIVGLGTVTHSVLPLRAYNLIWNEWFRDQNLQDSVPVAKDNGPGDVDDYTLLRRGKRHDYFTSCLPWPQKGDSVELPLGTVAPVLAGDATTPAENFPQLRISGDVTNTVRTLATSGGGGAVFVAPTAPVANATLLWVDPNLHVDLSAATAATINQLRQAFQVQRMLERDARGGTRYTEIVRAHFGVVSPDARLQRPEYLGGGSSPINITAVAQTSGTDISGQATPQGNLAAFGTAQLHNHGFVKSFTEHCLILGLVCVRADLTYQQGLHRSWSRNTRFDFYWPALSHIGEQAVLQKEIYCTGGVGDENVFGYQERHAEYRYKPSIITGKFRSTDATPLDAWHLAQEFASPPLLNSNFISENPPFDRVIATPSEPQFLFDSYFALRCARPMPTFGVPGFIDHF